MPLRSGSVCLRLEKKFRLVRISFCKDLLTVFVKGINFSCRLGVRSRTCGSSQCLRPRFDRHVTRYLQELYNPPLKMSCTTMGRCYYLCDRLLQVWASSRPPRLAPVNSSSRLFSCPSAFVITLCHEFLRGTYFCQFACHV